MRRLLLLAAGVLATGAPSAGAATIDVTVADDLYVADGRCSLREAVRSANLDAAPFAGAGECAAGDLADTINVPAGTFTLSITGPPDEDAMAGDLDLVAPLTIIGAGPGATTIDAQHIDRVLDVKSGVSVTLQGLTITGGKGRDSANGGDDLHGGDGNGLSATGGDAFHADDGGGIRNFGGLAITDCAIVDNEAGAGGRGGNAVAPFGPTGSSGSPGGNGTGGRGGAGGRGGGIFSQGSLTLVRVRIEGNNAGSGGDGGSATSGQGGGGISSGGGSGGNAFGGPAGNPGSGGGIQQIGGALLTIQQSVIAGNTAGNGGHGGAATAHDGGAGQNNGGTGGIAFSGDGSDGADGGGIVVGANANISSTLFSDNHAGDGGSGGNAAAGKGGALLSSSGNGGFGGEGDGGGGGEGGAGGGLWLGGAVTLTNVTLAGNGSGSGGTAGTGTGGKGGNTIDASGTLGSGGAGVGGDGGAAGHGGAIDGSATVAHATFTGNQLGISKPGGTGTGGSTGSAAGTGGTPGSSTIGASAVSAQGSAISRGLDPVTISASILAGNTTPACAGGSFGGANDISFGDPSCPGANADPLLGPLADNGGPAFTRRPGDGSAAIDGAPVDGCPATDQRGAVRPFGAGCDIGAYERAAPLVAITVPAATVQGTVNPDALATTYHFEFGVTAAYGSATPDVNLAAGVDLVPVSATLDGLAPNTTYHVRLVASNTDGSNASTDATFTTSAQGGGGGGDTTKPVILSASVKPKKFKARRGTTFRYRLSEAARVVFTIQRKKGKRYVRATRTSKASKTGANTKKLSTRKLKPGRYRATLVATDAAGNRSKAKRLTFRIVR